LTSRLLEVLGWIQVEEKTSMEVPLNVGVVYGSTRPGRFCDTVARWTASQIASRAGYEIELIDPANASDDMNQRLASCDAFVVVTPEYNHGYPAPLKQLIDSLGEEWHAKPVAFVSYGGISGGLRAVEQLRQVFAELHAVTIRDSVSFAGAWEQFDANGALRSPERAERSMEAMLRRLRWWAAALANARRAVPYTQSL
jgi:NAD(P)H-dependent FMN reductase